MTEPMSMYTIKYARLGNEATEKMNGLITQLKHLNDTLKYQVKATADRSSSSAELREQDMEDFGRRFHRISDEFKELALKFYQVNGESK